MEFALERLPHTLATKYHARASAAMPQYRIVYSYYHTQMPALVIILPAIAQILAHNY